MDRCCRICWNTANWRYPTGEAAALEQGKSYVREHGFGHEEWLFNFAWVQAGPDGGAARYRYGFLQPIGKFRNAYKGHSHNILLYAVAPNKQRIVVASIRDLFVPEDDELAEAHETTRRNGWLENMGEDLSRLSIRKAELVGAPAHLINVRFEQSNVSFLDPRVILPADHATYRLNRYHPLKWDGTLPNGGAAAASVRTAPRGGQVRSEAERTRAAVQSVTYNPRELIMQNAVYGYLCKQHGKRAVGYENEYVDLRLTVAMETTFFELKISNTVKGCLRRAIGQLLEYSTYPTKRLASKLIIVGDVIPNEDDRAYLEHLRREFGLPIYYQQWIWAEKRLGAEC